AGARARRRRGRSWRPPLVEQMRRNRRHARRSGEEQEIKQQEPERLAGQDERDLAPEAARPCCARLTHDEDSAMDTPPFNNGTFAKFPEAAAVRAQAVAVTTRVNACIGSGLPSGRSMSHMRPSGA